SCCVSFDLILRLSDNFKNDGKSGNFALVDIDFVEKNKTEIEKYFKIELDENNADYIYITKKLVELRGKKLQKKKNLVSQFLRNYPNYQILKMTKDDADMCFELAEKWCAQKNCEEWGFNHEKSALAEIFKNYNKLNVDGLLIKLDNNIIAFSLFSRQNDNTYTVHYEKFDNELKGCGHLGATGVDEWAVAIAKFPGDIVAQLSTGVAIAQENVVRIFGTKGYIFIPSPWVISRDGGESKIFVHIYGQSSPVEVTVKTDKKLYSIEADTVAENIENRQARFPAMTWDDTLGNMKTLDMWRQSIGLVYEMEKPERMTVPVWGRPLQPGKKYTMKYGEIKGLDKKVSKVLMGADNQLTFPHAAVMFDDFVERGGNAFDTAFIYAGGLCEKLLGEWIKSRNIRKDIVLLDKGAHTPYCNPEDLTKQLLISLERLQTDYIDIYMLHRDNPDIPVDEFVDVLNQHKKAGRIKIFGGSNWTPERIDQANEYARKKGLEGFSVVSNNFSLARMLAPIWQGVVSSSDEKSRKWFEERQIPLIAWSSQARGFFTGRYSPDDKSDAQMVRCWYSEDNFNRLERAKQLAEKLGVPTTAIALAYVLNQKFPVFALIGPRSVIETRSSLKTLEIELTEDQLKWLNLEK
ncbi:MAG TPA: aldo/keto reductase, partial [bacterium]|nr:aldo/keto reductase [bacterium]